MKIKNFVKSALIGSLLMVIGSAHASLNVGDVAPDWTLQATDGQTYQLSELRGKHVVLAFFPKAFTGVARLNASPCETAKNRSVVLTFSSLWRVRMIWKPTRPSPLRTTRTSLSCRTAARGSVSPTVCRHPWAFPSGGRSTLTQTARYPRSTKT